MKRIKLNILQVFILLFSVSIFITSCTSEETEQQIEEAVVENLNTAENRKLITDLFKNEQKLNAEIEKFRNATNTSRTTIEEVDLDQLLDDYVNCSNCPSEYKEFLEPFFEEVIETDDDQIISKIESYESLINSTNLSDTHKDNLRFTLFSFKEASNYALNNPEYQRFASRDNSPGKNIGRGLAWGFLAGCAQGAWVGATVGTVTVPIIGTVTGAVAGCIASGAAAGTVGAVGAAVWSFVDSIF